jgi:hypothetical protein
MPNMSVVSFGVFGVSVRSLQVTPHGQQSMRRRKKRRRRRIMCRVTQSQVRIFD